MSIFIWAASRLPSTYQEVEYIESSGTQYIDLWMVFTNNVNVEMDIAFTAARSGWSGIIWANKQNSSYSWAWGISASSMTYQKSGSSDKHIDWSWTPTLNEKYNFSLSGSTVKRDGTTVATISWTIGTYSTPINATLFKVASQSSSNSWFPYNVSARIYYCKVYSSGTTLTRNLIPCYRKSDSVVWMYDLINSVFYTNSWTGTFAKWADVYLNELKEAYLWYSWKPNSNTVVYRPLKEDFKDYSWNWYDLTSNGTITLTTLNWAKCSKSSWGSAYLQSTTVPLPSWSSARTISMRYAEVTSSSTHYMFMYGEATSPKLFWLNTSSWNFRFNYGWNLWTSYYVTLNQWALYTITWWSWTLKIYVNGNQELSTTSYSLNTTAVSSTYTCRLFNRNNNTSYPSTWYLSDVIVENKVWSASEILDYYNDNKASYWL